MRVELPDGAWAELYAPRKVRERARRRYKNASLAMALAVMDIPEVPNPHAGEEGQPATIPDPKQMSADILEMQDTVTDMAILCLVKEWSFGSVDEDTLATLDAETADALVEHVQPLAQQLTPDMVSPDPDPKATTGASTPPAPMSSTEADPCMTRSTALTS